MCDAPLTLRRKLGSIGASTAKWTKQERKMWKRLLDARRVAENLEEVMKDIHKANERFLVRSSRGYNAHNPTNLVVRWRPQ
jgi:formate-dependent nitrite reductase cytochrome c552 subunit